MNIDQRLRVLNRHLEDAGGRQRALVKEITEATKEVLRIAEKRERALKKKRHG